MAMPPLLIDQVSIAPGNAGTRSLQRDAGTGALSFTDSVSGTLLLSQLANLGSVAGVILVGKSGAGAQYTDITSALATIPSNASQTNPYVILVMPGVYVEDVVLDRDGVVLLGVGYVEVASASDAHTLTVQEGPGTTPRWASVHNIVFTNTYNGKATVRVIGAAASNVALNGITFLNCHFQAEAAGGNRSIWATSCGPLFFRECRWADNGLSMILLQEVMGFEVCSGNLPAFIYRYDTGQDIPAGAYLGGVLQGCIIGLSSTLDPVLDVDLNGAGSLRAANLHVNGNTRVQGDQTVRPSGCFLEGDLFVLETSKVHVDRAPSGTVTVAGAAQYSSEYTTGVETFSGSTKVVSFGYALGTAAYDVALEMTSQPVNDEAPWVTGKLATGFTINFGTAQTLTVNWSVRRRQ
jgi:hypothetical protein